MANVKMWTDTLTTLPYVQEFWESWDCPLVEKTYTETRLDMYVGGADVPTISYVGGYIYLFGKEFVFNQNSSQPGNILLAVYSDTFFHYWHFACDGSTFGAWLPRMNYVYEVIKGKSFEGYGPRDHYSIDFSCKDTIYNCPMFTDGREIVYEHKNWMNYAGNDNSIDMAPDFLFQYNTASEFDSSELIACSEVPRHQVVVVDGKEYFSLEEHLLIPLDNGDTSNDIENNEES